jgi:hypothetical protein
MDPYLEKHWRDIHAGLIVYARDQLESRLPRSLMARVEERIVFECDEREHHRYPDARVVESSHREPEGGGTALAVATEEAVESFVVRIDTEPMTETFIEILDASTGNRVVTVIEFLSLSNKTPGESMTSYRRKQQELRSGNVSLVEIDLLRSGERGRVLPQRTLKPRKRKTYMACVRRGWQPGLAELFPISLRQPLPPIKIPFRQTDEEIRLELQPLIGQAYLKGRYSDNLDYRLPAEPPLEGDDAARADELLKAAGRR